MRYILRHTRSYESPVYGRRYTERIPFSDFIFSEQSLFSHCVGVCSLHNNNNHHQQLVEASVGQGRSQRSVFVLKYVLVYNLDRIKS